MADFWNAFATGQAVRDHFNDRNVRRAEREARLAQIGAARQQYGDVSGGDVTTGIAAQGAQRDQQTFDINRGRQQTFTTLSTYNAALEDLAKRNPDLTPEQQAEARAQIYDRLAPGLQAAGATPEDIQQLRGLVVEHPEAVPQLLEGLQANVEGSRTSPQAAVDPVTGEAYFMDNRGRRVGTGAPASVVLGQGRLDVSEGNLEQRTRENDPNYREDRALADRSGQNRADIAITLPRLDEITDTAMTRINELQDSPALDTIFGLPNLARLSEGGFGAAGVVPGTPAADALAMLNRTIGDVQTAAYESLRGGGQITEAEREAISRGLANLERAQSPQSAVRALRELSRVLDSRRQAAHRAASTPVQDVIRGRAPAPAASAGGGTQAAPQSNTDVDAILRDRGL